MVGEPNILILGPVRATSDGAMLALGGPKQRALLVALALEPRRTVQVRRLVDLIWEEPPISAIANLRTYAAGLRKSLGPCIAARDGGYRLELEDDSVDLGRFHSLAHAGRKARRHGDLDAASSLLGQAANLWSGSCAEDLPDGMPIRWQLVSIDDARAGVLDDLSAVRLELGEAAGLVEPLRRRLHDDPTRETTWIHLIMALGQVGDIGAALSAYRQAREALTTRLGVDPGPELQRLHHDLLQRKVPRHPSGTLAPARAPKRLVPRELPPSPTPLVGRDPLVARLVATARPTEERGGPAVIAVGGAGGVGKTALALAVAAQVEDAFPDGNVFLDLRAKPAPTPEAEQASRLRRLLSAVGVSARGDDNLPSLAARWRSATADRSLLLVLDDAPEGTRLAELIPNSSRCTVLVTTRRLEAALDVTSYVHLDVLERCDSVSLLTTVGGRLGPGDDSALHAIAALCDDLPLALRLAAARLRARPDWGWTDLAERLSREERRLDLLDGSAAAVRSVLTSGLDDLRSSPSALDRLAADAFALLGRLPLRSFPEQVFSLLLDLDPHLGEQVGDRLVELHLIRRVSDRYRIHDLLRLLAKEQQPSLTEDQVRRSLTTLGSAFACWADRARRRTRRLDAAVGQGAAAYDERLSPALSTPEEAHLWLATEESTLLDLLDPSLLVLLPAGTVTSLVRALQQQSDLSGRFTRALDLARLLARHGRSQGDLLAEHIGWRLTAVNYQCLGEATAARAAIRRAATLAEGGDRVERVATLNALGIMQTEWEQWDQAEETLTRNLAEARALGSAAWVALALNSLGMHYRHRSMTERAVPFLRETLVLRRALSDRVGEVHTLRQLGRALGDLGSYDEGISLLAESLRRAEQLDAKELVRQAHVDRLAVEAGAGRRSAARRTLRRALAVCHELDDLTLTDEVLREAERFALAP